MMVAVASGVTVECYDYMCINLSNNQSLKLSALELLKLNQVYFKNSS